MLANWEALCDRIDHLGELAEDLKAAVHDGDQSGWVYREIAQEAAVVAELASSYVEEFERARIYFSSGADRGRTCRRSGDEP